MAIVAITLANFLDPVLIALVGLWTFISARNFMPRWKPLIVSLVVGWLFLGFSKPLLEPTFVDNFSKPSTDLKEELVGYSPWNEIVGTPYETYSDYFFESVNPRQTNNIKLWLNHTKILRARDCRVLLASMGESHLIGLQNQVRECRGFSWIGSLGAGLVWFGLFGFILVRRYATQVNEPRR